MVPTGPLLELRVMPLLGAMHAIWHTRPRPGSWPQVTSRLCLGFHGVG